MAKPRIKLTELNLWKDSWNWGLPTIISSIFQAQLNENSVFLAYKGGESIYLPYRLKLCLEFDNKTNMLFTLLHTLILWPETPYHAMQQELLPILFFLTKGRFAATQTAYSMPNPTDFMASPQPLLALALLFDSFRSKYYARPGIPLAPQLPKIENIPARKSRFIAFLGRNELSNSLTQELWSEKG